MFLVHAGLFYCLHNPSLAPRLLRVLMIFNVHMQSFCTCINRGNVASAEFAIKAITARAFICIEWFSLQRHESTGGMLRTLKQRRWF